MHYRSWIMPGVYGVQSKADSTSNGQRIWLWFAVAVLSERIIGEGKGAGDMCKLFSTTKTIIYMIVVLFLSNYLAGSSLLLKINQPDRLAPNRLQNGDIYLPVISKACSVCYFVDSVSGLDSNSGKSPLEPWQTLDPVNRLTFSPGSAIYFKRGSNWTGQLFLTSSGVQGNPIVYTTYGSGPKPVFRNPGNEGNLTSVVNIQSSWVVVEGLMIMDNLESGIYMENNHNIIQDNEITQVGIGIDIEGQYNLIARNTIHKLHMVLNSPGGNNDDYGATGILMNNGSNNEIMGNTIFDCTSPSYDFETGGHAFELFRISNNNYIHHNLAYNNNQFSEASGGESKNNTFAYNVVIDNGVFSYIHLIDTAPTITENFRVENNTIINTNRINQWAEVIGFEGNPSENTFVLQNNIFYISGLRYIFYQDGFTHKHNIYSVGGITKPGFLLDSTEKLADPGFVDLEKNNFHLATRSPAIDAGLNLNYRYDFDHVLIPNGLSPDIGAYEFQQ